MAQFRASFDVRGKPLSQARHWSAPKPFGNRAYFRTVQEPAQLVVEDVRRHDEGVYRCRVDFRNTPTRSFRYRLSVIVTFLQQRFILKHLDDSVNFVETKADA
ncbi:Uncharacterized protein GBIM_05287 [Gryllus bimaculatus]|nr:Uncharacterized protein GBIM_05287 [Gryllus bimaculatus]